MAEDMAVDDFQVWERHQCAKVQLLTLRGVRVVGKRFDPGGEVLDSLYAVLRKQDGTEFGEVKPFIRGILDAAKIEVERVNVYVGFHWRVLKKQGPLQQERPRALLLKQPGVMILENLSHAPVIVKAV